MLDSIAPPLVVEGSRAAAEQAPDGTWVIRGVPLFAEHVGRSASTGLPVQVDRAWLDRCVELQRDEYRRNEYLPPLHINHHDFGDGPVEDAGVFLPTHVAPAMTREGEVLAVYGDFVKVKPAVYERIRRKELPYLSCEVNLDSGHLESCALLPTRPPRHKFRPLTIGTEKPVAKNSLLTPAVVAYFAPSPGGESRVLTRVPTIMTDDEKKAEDAKKASETASATQTDKNAAPAPAPAPAATPPVAPAAAPAAAPAVDPVSAKLDQILAMLAKLLAAEVAENDTPGKTAEVKGTPSTAYADAAVAKTIGELQGTVSSLKARLDSKDADATKAAELAELDGRLTKYGARAEVFRKELRTAYAAGGKTQGEAFVRSIEATMPPAPAGSTLDGVAATGESAVALPTEILAKYGSKGPDELAVIAKHVREYERLGGQAALRRPVTEYVESMLPWQRK